MRSIIAPADGRTARGCDRPVAAGETARADRPCGHSRVAGSGDGGAPGRVHPPQDRGGIERISRWRCWCRLRHRRGWRLAGHVAAAPVGREPPQHEPLPFPLVPEAGLAAAGIVPREHHGPSGGARPRLSASLDRRSRRPIAQAAGMRWMCAGVHFRNRSSWATLLASGTAIVGHPLRPRLPDQTACSSRPRCIRAGRRCRCPGAGRRRRRGGASIHVARWICGRAAWPPTVV